MTDLTIDQVERHLRLFESPDEESTMDMAQEWLERKAPGLARTVIALHAELAQARADAQAAVALVVERADLAVQAVSAHCETDGERLAIVKAVDEIRALAPDAGVKALAELRAERDDYADQLADLVPTLNREAVEQRNRAIRLTAELAQAVAAAEQQDALRAVTLATMQSVSAANAALEEKVRGLVEAGKSLADRLGNERGDYINMSDVMSAISAYDAALAAMQPAEGEKG